MSSLQTTFVHELRQLIANYALVSIQDERTFVAQAYAAYELLPANRVNASGVRTAVLQTLCRHIHTGLRSWDNDAATDIWRIAYVISRGCGANEGEAGEIAQEIAIQLLTKPDQMNDPAALFAWVRVIVRRKLHRRWGGDNRVTVEADLPDLDEDEQPLANISARHDFTVDVESKIIMAQALRILEGCGLTQRQLEIIMLFYLYNLTIEEISIKLGNVRENIRNLKSKALKKLRISPGCRERLRVVITGIPGSGEE